MNRGGSWNNDASNCRAANRNVNAPSNRNNNLGLRLARAPPEQRRLADGTDRSSGSGLPLPRGGEGKGAGQNPLLPPGVSSKCERSGRLCFLLLLLLWAGWRTRGKSITAVLAGLLSAFWYLTWKGVPAIIDSLTSTPGTGPIDPLQIMRLSFFSSSLCALQVLACGIALLALIAERRKAGLSRPT